VRGSALSVAHHTKLAQMETQRQLGSHKDAKAQRRKKGFQFTASRQTGYSAFTAYGRQVNLLPDCRSQEFSFCPFQISSTSPITLSLSVPKAMRSINKQVTLRVDADLIDRFRATGKGWQSRINEALRKAAGI
jgi:BrnA antitoxin of type II toxin-antitoxin system